MAKKGARLWDGSAGAAENAKKALPRLATRFFRKGRKLVAENASYEQLHAFRLEAKRFRYTLELFRPLYGPGLERRLAALRQLQQYLGEINDCVVTRTLFENLGAQRSRDAGLFRFLDQEASRIAAEYRLYWSETFDQPGQERLWTAYLRTFAGRT
jgi:CHAD domain-containing protein